MIDIRKLKELIKLMVENDLSELDIRDQEETVTLRRRSDDAGMAQQPIMYQGAAPAAAPAAVAAPAGDSASEAAASNDAGLVAIESPMVGTFYAATSPDAPPLVSSGASISPDSVVCLVEAMKVFNEIKAEVGGTVERVLVKNGDAVEFGQKLFMIRPN